MAASALVAVKSQNRFVLRDRGWRRIRDSQHSCDQDSPCSHFGKAPSWLVMPTARRYCPSGGRDHSSDLRRPRSEDRRADRSKRANPRACFRFQPVRERSNSPGRHRRLGQPALAPAHDGNPACASPPVSLVQSCSFRKGQRRRSRMRKSGQACMRRSTSRFASATAPA